LLRGQGDDDNRKLATLAFVDRDGICQRNLVQLPEIIDDVPLVEPNDHLLLDWVNFSEDANVPLKTSLS